MVKSKKTFRSQTVASQNPETELLLDGDDDAVSLLQEKEMDNLGGKSAQNSFINPKSTPLLLEHRHLSFICPPRYSWDSYSD